MEIIKPSIELWRQDDAIAHVARCARVCYASDKTTGNEAMYNRLLDAGHHSMFRHESIYIIAPYRSDRHELIDSFESCPFVEYATDRQDIYISTNRQFFMENEAIQYFNEWIVEPLEFENTPIGFTLMRYTFKIVTQISTSRELNRVSPNNIAEQSTRYVNLSKKGGAICQPHWINDKVVDIYTKGGIKECSMDDYVTPMEFDYLAAAENSFKVYNDLMDGNVLPQDARGVLPLDTATVCVYTYTVNEWRHIIDLRYYGTTGAAHPNARIIASMIKNELENLGYEFK